MSATVASGRVFDAFVGADLGPLTFYHGHSYGGNALAAAVALEHLRLVESWDVLANVRARAAPGWRNSWRSAVAARYSRAGGPSARADGRRGVGTARRRPALGTPRLP